MGPPRRTPSWLWAATPALVAGLFAAAAFCASRSGDSEAPPTTPGPTTEPPVTRSPATTAATPSTTEVQRSASSPQSVAGTGPVFGEPVGMVLTGLANIGSETWLVTVDLDTGDLQQVPVDAGRLDSVQGTVVAAGPTVLVDERCASPVECSWVAHPLDQATGVTLSADGTPASGPAAISPNGQRMAVFANRHDGAPVQLLVANLLSGDTSSVVSNDYDELTANVRWVTDDLLLFSQGIDFRAVRVDASGGTGPPEHVMAGGQELRFVTFALARKPT